MSKTARSKKKELVETTSQTVEMPAPSSEPTMDEIALRAYEIYLERGDAPGSDTDDWLRAERELRGEK